VFVCVVVRLSQLKRSFGLRRTRLRRLAGARTRVGLGIFAYNLQRMTVLAASITAGAAIPAPDGSPDRPTRRC
jgi:hypothetical protein